MLLLLPLLLRWVLVLVPALLPVIHRPALVCSTGRGRGAPGTGGCVADFVHEFYTMYILSAFSVSNTTR